MPTGMPQPTHYMNPVHSFLEVASNPILSGQTEPEHIDNADDLLASFKVHRYSRRLWAALLAEFLGLCIFQIYGGSANDDVAALSNGFTLAVIVYATCNVSGGHLNPAVTFANCLTGHMSWSRGGTYVTAQILGGIFGALIESGLMPDVSPGDGSGPGCFTHLKGVQISKAQLFWWECIMTFLLVCVVYATAVTKPGHGSLAPLAIGITLYASAAVGGPFTGAALNPARVLGPTLVFDCFWNTAFIYVFGQLLGGLLAAVLVLPLYGFGQFGSVFDTRIAGWLGLSGPRRFQQLPEQDGIPHPPPFTSAVPAQPLPVPATDSRKQQVIPAQPQSRSPASSPSGSPTAANQVYGNPQLGTGPAASHLGRPLLSVIAQSQSGGHAPAPLRASSAAASSEFLPENWRLGSTRKP